MARQATAEQTGDVGRQTSPELSVMARSEWTARRIVLGTLTVIGVALVFLFLYRLYMVVFMLFAAVALHVALSPVVEWLYRRHISRGLGVMIVYTFLLVSLGLALWFGIPPLIQQSTAVIQDTPQYYQSGREYLTEAPIALVRRLGRLLPEEFSMSMLMLLAESGKGDGNGDVESTSNVELLWISLRTVFAVLAIFVLAYYWTLEGNTILRKLVMKVPATQREELRAMMAEFQGKIGAYFRGTIFLCGVVGGASMLAFWAIGIPNAILLGVIMGIFEAIPVVGPVLGAIPAILLTLVFDPDKTLWVLAAVLVIQGLEGNILVPRVMDQSVGVNPVVSLLAITAFGALFGVAGALLAIPMAAIVQILLGRILFNTPIRQDLATPPTSPEAISRSGIGVLRLEAQEIIQDLHKISAPADDDGNQHNVDHTEDRLEALAVELDALLAGLERRPPSVEPAPDHAWKPDSPT